MKSRLVVLIGIAFILTLACVGIYVLMPEYRIQLAAFRQARLSDERDPKAISPVMGGMTEGEYDTISLLVEIPAASELDITRSCPYTQTGSILGIRIQNPRGTVVGSVIEGGPADKAGIKPGDGIGPAHLCVKDIMQSFMPGDEPRKIELVIRRPKAAETEEDQAETKETEAELVEESEN